MSEIRVEELLKLTMAALKGAGFSGDDAGAIATEFVAAEVAGTRTHGVGKLPSMNLGDLNAEPSEIRMGCVLSVDGMGSNGFILMRRLAQRAVSICEEFGVGVVLAKNFSRYSSLYPYTEIVASKGNVAILMNNAGPPAVAPFGGIDPITGTNPVCFSFPIGSGEVQTFDFATSEMVWGAIRQSAIDGVALPSGAFLDAEGNAATEPSQVNAVRAFGGSKGWAINLAIELLCGISGAPAGSGVESEFDCGALLIAFDPRRLGAGEKYATLVEQVLAEVRESRPERGFDDVRVPGDSPHGQAILSDLDSKSDMCITVADTTLELLHRMSRGEGVGDLASNPLFN